MGHFFTLFIMLAVTLSCDGQREPGIPLSKDSFRQILRSIYLVPIGRVTSITDVRIDLYSTNTTKLNLHNSYSISGDVKRLLLQNPNFHPEKRTVLYAHGYVELFSDDSVRRVMQAYLDNGGYNALFLDWSNLAYQDYFSSALALQAIGNETGKAIWSLVEGGLSLESLHLVGHSMGAHVLGAAARYLKARGLEVPRLTGLDPAYLGFYPPLLGPGLSAADAAFVDVLHTDGGGFGTPTSTGHADFWPNEGQAKQPGCLSATVPFTTEGMISQAQNTIVAIYHNLKHRQSKIHWRSWEYWAESLAAGRFLARRCDSYDSFLRGRCRDAPPVYMGVGATKHFSGNLYLRTAAKQPFALGERGAE